MKTILGHETKIKYWVFLVLIIVIFITLLKILFHSDEGILIQNHFYVFEEYFKGQSKKILSRRKLLYDLSRAASIDPKVAALVKCLVETNQNKTLEFSRRIGCQNKKQSKLILVISFGFEVDALGM